MSNITTVYANHVGLPLPKKSDDYPSNFIPVPENYIVIYTGGDFHSLKYDYYNTAISLLKPYLKDMQIVQIGTKDDYVIEGALDYRGKSNFRQTAFIVENSKLLISNDSVWNYVAGNKNIPFISLYSVLPSQSSMPTYKGECVILESHRNGDKPSYSADENPKTINLIKPEEVAQAASNFLRISYKHINSKKIGMFYNIHQIDFIPDCKSPNFQTENVACRMDINYNVQGMLSFFAQQRGFLVTASPIPIDVIQALKEKIKEISYVIDNNVSETFVKTLHKSGIPYKLITYKTGEDLKNLKFKLFDYNQVLSKPPPNIAGIESTDSFMTNRVYFGRGIKYPSLYHYVNDLKDPDLKVGDALGEHNFLEAFDNYYFYN